MKLLATLGLVAILAGCSVIAESTWPQHCYKTKDGECKDLQPRKAAPIKEIRS